MLSHLSHFTKWEASISECCLSLEQYLESGKHDKPCSACDNYCRKPYTM